MLLLVFCDISSNCQRSFMHACTFALFWAISLRWISKAMLTILKMFATLAVWQCWGSWHLKRYCLEILKTQSNQNSGMGPHVYQWHLEVRYWETAQNHQVWRQIFVKLPLRHGFRTCHHNSGRRLTNDMIMTRAPRRKSVFFTNLAADRRAA